MGHYFYIPNNLDIDTILEKYDFTHIDAFHKDNLYYILHLISEIPANNKDKITADGYVPIHSKILREWIRQYEPYKNYLIMSGVIESDNTFTLGSKSTGYKFTPTYRVGLRRVLVTHIGMIKKLKEWQVQYDYVAKLRTPALSSANEDNHIAPIDQYKALAKWYSPSILSLDAQAAHRYNYSIYVEKLNDPSIRDRKYKHDGSFEVKDPYLQYVAGIRNIDRLKDGNYNLHADTNVYRLHSAMTNCKKELRDFVTIKGQPVSAVDLSNSQPTLMLLLLNPSFWDGTGGFNHTHIPYLNIDTIFSTIEHKHTLINLLKNVQHNDSAIAKEVGKYREMVVKGRFYEDFSSLVREGLGITVTKEEVKPMIFTVLFTSNRFINQAQAAPKRIFRDLFPNIYEVLKLIKRKDPNSLPILLQRIESYIMYYRICPAIAQVAPDLPIIPIHDSIATIRGNEGQVESVMRTELSRCLGVTPHFKTEHWQPQAVYSLAA